MITSRLLAVIFSLALCPIHCDHATVAAAVAGAHPRMTARRCRDDMIERSDSAERIEATLAKDPMANAEANDPMEPMDRNDPTLPIDRIEFFDPIDRIEFSDRIEHQLPRLVTNEDYGSRQRQ